MSQRQLSTIHVVALATVLLIAAVGELAAQAPQAQHIYTPMASPRATVSQRVGLTDVEVTYHRPAVNEREIWGGVVPMDQVWRTGANENTVVSFSTDVMVQGEKLAAGSYGLHTIPGETEWTIIFSHDDSAWGSFSYDEKNDALRVKVKPRPAGHVERFAIYFEDLEPTAAGMVLHWEKVAVPVEVAVDHETVVASFRDQLKGLSGFFWQGWNQAAQYCLSSEMTNYDEMMQWAERSIGAEERFENLSTKAQILIKTGKENEADAIMARALEMGNAGQLHNYARQLLIQGEKERALAIFQRNVEQNPDAWFVQLGLARGYSALGRFDQAAASMKLAHGKAPEGQKSYVAGLIQQLEEKRDIN